MSVEFTIILVRERSRFTQIAAAYGLGKVFQPRNHGSK